MWVMIWEIQEETTVTVAGVRESRRRQREGVLKLELHLA